MVCAAIVWAVKNRQLFYGIPFVVVSGHQPLKKDAAATAPWKKDAGVTTTSAVALEPADDPKKDAGQLPMELVEIEKAKQELEKK